MGGEGEGAGTGLGDGNELGAGKQDGTRYDRMEQGGARREGANGHGEWEECEIMGHETRKRSETNAT